MSAQDLRRTFAVPGVIALSSIVGLVSALVGDGMFDAVSWLALGTVVGAVLWAAAVSGNRG
ncbi:hypothetical protein [Luteimonas salinilitoris]|uniref:DUF4175 domain-containing protein n=1 Tax=Luteimonas salinilitoris TaxID=3237697 RepID=A0ABV4HVN2_9GAMM